jgi:hypothetical protein
MGAALKTDRIRLGTGMLIPSNRIAPVAAKGLATLNALARAGSMPASGRSTPVGGVSVSVK